jgi:uncharacterized membrane protein
MKSDRLARAVHVCLLAGSAVSAVLFTIGLFLILSRAQVRPTEPPQIGSALLRSAVDGDGFAVLDLGVITLMLTPLLRIIVLATGWTARRDFRFALVALLVLALLISSLLIGFG